MDKTLVWLLLNRKLDRLDIMRQFNHNHFIRPIFDLTKLMLKVYNLGSNLVQKNPMKTRSLDKIGLYNL